MVTNWIRGYSCRRKFHVFLAVFCALVCLSPAISLSQDSMAARQVGAGGQGTVIPSPGNPYWWVQIDYMKHSSDPALADTPRVPWADSDFADFARRGMNGAEINLTWDEIEPQRGKYNFELLDRYLASAARANIGLYLIFWESVWAKNPPKWITVRDITSDGFPALQPPWWDEDSRKAYFDYVARTIEHVNGKPGFGGLFANYGWLDAMWGPVPKGSHGFTGYAPADVQAFYRWLPSAYKSLGAFNSRWHTTYDDWSHIPVPKPGDPLFAVYQEFRHESVIQTYDELSKLVRARTKAPMLYYWGGGIGGGGGPAVLGNDPDIFFKAAKRYDAIVVLDDADNSGIALMFGSLARSYGVPLLQEWTPESHGLREETGRWLGHLGFGSPFEIGGDFFIYPTAFQQGYADAWVEFQAWHGTVAQIKGQTPEQPVAVLVPTYKIAVNPDRNSFPRLNELFGEFWRTNHVLPHFITDQQVADGVVNLEKFVAVVDLGNERAELPALKAYGEKHKVLENLSQTLPLLHPYVTLDPSYNFLEVLPVVDGDSVWLTLANCNEKEAYYGVISFDPEAVGLKRGSYDVEDVRRGLAAPAVRNLEGKVRWQVDLPAAGFQIVRLSPGKSAAN